MCAYLVQITVSKCDTQPSNDVNYFKMFYVAVNILRRLVASFANQIKSEYYGGNRSVSIEGIALEHYSAAPQADIMSSTLARQRYALFYSFLSDDSKQDAATTTAHSKLLISLLKKKVLTTSLRTIWENTGSSAEQYRCASELYLMSVMSQTYSVIIDRGISAPGNGKEVVDGHNAVDKRYIYQLMSKVQLPGSVIFYSQIKMHTGTENKDVSLSHELKNNLEEEHRQNGAIDQGKSRKRFMEIKWTERKYHFQDNASLEITTQPSLGQPMLLKLLILANNFTW